jgi:hypothetical protein
MAVFFLWHCPSRPALANHAQVLPGSLSTGARTFLELSIAWILTRDRPTDCSSQYNNMTNQRYFLLYLLLDAGVILTMAINIGKSSDGALRWPNILPDQVTQPLAPEENHAIRLEAQ